MTKRRWLEHIKTAVLVVLFISTILLLYLLWKPEGKVSFSELIGIRQTQEAYPEGLSVLSSDGLIYSPGDTSFSFYKDTEGSIKSAAYEELRVFLSKNYVELAEITEDQYLLAMGGYPSARLVYDCAVPFADLCRMIYPQCTLDLGKGVLTDMIGFSEASSDSVFCVDTAKGKYYRFIFGEPADSVEKIASALPGPGEACYTANEVLGAGRAVVILTADSTMAPSACAAETAVNADYRENAVSRIFGDTFDFVRRIDDGFGNRTYMYGYGRKNIYLYSNGDFEYSTTESGKEETSFESDLTAALAFAANCGGFSGSPWEDLNLCGYSEEVSGTYTVRHFEFAQQLGKKMIFSETGSAVSVTVSGGAITHLYRSGLSFSRAEVSPASDIASAANVIAANCNHIYNVLNDTLLAQISDESLIYSARAAVSVRSGYFAQNKEWLVPAWIYTAADGTRFYFDLYTGSPLDYTRQGGKG